MYKRPRRLCRTCGLFGGLSFAVRRLQSSRLGSVECNYEIFHFFNFAIFYFALFAIFFLFMFFHFFPFVNDFIRKKLSLFSQYHIHVFSQKHSLQYHYGKLIRNVQYFSQNLTLLDCPLQFSVIIICSYSRIFLNNSEKGRWEFVKWAKEGAGAR